MPKTIVLLSVFVIASLIGRSQYIEYDDSLTAERFFEDSVGGTYMIEYRYSDPGSLVGDKKTFNDRNKFAPSGGDSIALFHAHYIANCSVIKYKGNRKQIIFANYKSIYSPTECSSDSRELWLKRLYLYQNRK